MGSRKRRDKFLQLAKKRPDGWPVIKSGVFRSHELVDAMRESVADYVKGGNIRAIGDFIEEAASLLPEGHGYREMVSDELCEFYGFIGDNESAWKTCVKHGSDCNSQNYFAYALHCPQREFSARQAYSASETSFLTENGKQNRAEIYASVDVKLAAFREKHGKHLLDYYYDICVALAGPCIEFLQSEGIQTHKPHHGSDAKRGAFFSQSAAEAPYSAAPNRHNLTTPLCTVCC